MKNLSSSEKSFLTLWGAELISGLGSSLLSFSLMVWLFQQTHQSALLGFLMFAYMGPQIYLALFGGAVVDRFSRKALLWVAELVQGLSSGLILILFLNHSLSFSWIFSITLVNGVFAGLQNLIFLSSLSSFVSKERLLSFNGLMQIFKSIPTLIAPLLALPLLHAVKLSGILAFDIFTFSLSLFLLWKVPFPQEQKKVSHFKWETFKEGVLSIFQDKALKKSLFFFIYNNFLTGLVSGLIIAFIIEQAGASSPWVAYNASLTALGSLVGALLLMKVSKRIQFPFLVMAWTMILASLSGRLGVVFVGSSFMVGSLFFLRNSCLPVINACNDTLWQERVPQALQGRVFGARRFLAQGLYPLGLLLGPMLVSLIGLSPLFVIVGLLEICSPLFLMVPADHQAAESTS